MRVDIGLAQDANQRLPVEARLARHVLDRAVDVFLRYFHFVFGRFLKLELLVDQLVQGLRCNLLLLLRRWTLRAECQKQQARALAYVAIGNGLIVHDRDNALDCLGFLSVTGRHRGRCGQGQCDGRGS